MPLIPSASTIANLFDAVEQMVEPLGESMRGEKAVLIYSGSGFTTMHAAALWSQLPERDELEPGGFVLQEKIAFSIRKDIMPTALAKRARIRCSLKGLEGKTYLIEAVKQTTGDRIAWLFEARRDQGGDA